MKKIISFIFFISILMCGIHTASAKTVVFMYHDVTDNPLKQTTWSISTNELESDIQYFLNNGFNILSPTDLVEGRAKASANNVVLTFDDGYESFYTTVFPILQKYKVKASVYVIASLIDKHTYLNKEQIYELGQSPYVEVGNHTNILHRRGDDYLKVLYGNTVNDNDIFYDIKKGNAAIEEALGHKVTTFTFPNGIYNKTVNQRIKSELGYTSTFSTKYGSAGTNYTLPINRVNRAHGESAEKMFNRVR